MLSPFEKEKEIHGKLLNFLMKSPKGLTTTDIAKATGISRKTLEKHLQLLVFENELHMKQFGPTRVYYPNTKANVIGFEKFTYKNRTFWFDLLENEYGKFLIIQEKRRDGEEGSWETKGSILIPVESGDDFIKALTKILNSKTIKSFSK